MAKRKTEDTAPEEVTTDEVVSEVPAEEPAPEPTPDPEPEARPEAHPAPATAGPERVVAQRNYLYANGRFHAQGESLVVPSEIAKRLRAEGAVK